MKGTPEPAQVLSTKVLLERFIVLNALSLALVAALMIWYIESPSGVGCIECENQS